MGLHEMRRAVLVLLVAAVAGIPAPAEAQPGSVAGPVAVRAADGSTLLLEGFGPVHGDLEIRRDGGSLSVVNALTLEDYVAGIAEVPGDWPMEALKAQAVAARTYALWERSREHWQRSGYDVCATTACQVYAGALAERGEGGRRWAEAVRATAGEVLVHAGEPALTRYHASSGGRTLPNEAVYPSSGPRPYLRAVDDPTDEVSPLHRWTVDFRREDLERILREAISLRGVLTGVESDQDARRLVIRTEGGELDMTTSRFRRLVSAQAPRSFPGLYPGDRPDGRTMPMTLPSSRFDVEPTPDGFRLHGRGYGHGVGMSQWGAMGRAERGEGYREILSAYYSGLEPQAFDVPDTIRVAVLEGADAARISGDGPFGVRDAGASLADSTLGGWGVTAGTARTLRVSPPEGHDLPLVLSGVRAPREVVLDPSGGTDEIAIDFVVPKPADVEAVLRRDGEDVARAKGVVEAGAHTIHLRPDPGSLPRRADYRVELRAFDGADEVRAAAGLTITRPGPLLWPRAVLASVVALGALWWFRRRVRERGPQSSAMPDRVGQLDPHG
jgi:stage II sporulation protein D